MDTPIDPEFMAHGYSMILLRQEGRPVVFFGDLYGLELPHVELPQCGGKLPDLVLARRLFAFGEQTNYFKDSDCIGWVRHGTTEKPDGMAVVLSWTQEVPDSSDDEEELPRIQMKAGYPGQVFVDLLGWDKTEVLIDASGMGVFQCGWNSVSVYVNRDASGREQFPVKFDTNFGKLCP
jgi:alpha-amylase